MHQYLAIMLEHFLQLTLEKPSHVLSYIPMPERNEVTPQYFEETLREVFPYYQLCYPKTDFKLHLMEAVAHDDDMQTATTQFGVTEPVNGNVIPTELIDIIFVPLAAFDKKGYRVGYGKGFYDRFIPRCRQNVVTIGLSFFEAVDEITDATQFDIPLKYCITPRQLYEF